MPDYITYLNNKILEKYRSVPPTVMADKPNVLEVSRETMDLLEKSRFYVVENGRVRPMTTVEIDALLAEEQAVTTVEENALLAQIDDDIFALSDFPMAKTDLLIDNIKDLEGVKLFLKRLVKYVAKNTSF